MAATANTPISGQGRIGGLVRSAAAAPTVDNDVLNGVLVGDVWEAVGGEWVCVDNTAGAAVWHKRTQAPSSVVTERVISETSLGNGSVLRRAYIEEAKVVSAGSVNLTTQLPAGARNIQASMNFDTLIVLSTATKVGLGIAGTPSGFALSGATMTKNTKTDNAAPTTATLAAATTVAISSVDNSGAAAGTFTSGTVRARLTYEYVTSIGNAP